MPSNMTWPQARKLAIAGQKVRRAGSEFWIVSDSEVIWRRDNATDVLAPSYFSEVDFLATDWTTEHWLTPDEDGGIQPPGGGSGGGNAGGGGVTDGADIDPPELDPVVVALRSEADKQPGSATATNGGGSFSAPGGGGGGGGGSGARGARRRLNGGPNDAAPRVVVAVGFAQPDNVTCYSTVPTVVTVYATVFIDGGPAGPGSLSVVCPTASNTPQLAMGHAGFSRTFEFENVDYNAAGGAITVSASYSPWGGGAVVNADGVAPFFSVCPDAIDTVTEVSYSCTSGVIRVELKYTKDAVYTFRTWEISAANGLMGSAYSGVCPSAHSLQQIDGKTYLKLTFAGPVYEYIDVSDPVP